MKLLSFIFLFPFLLFFSINEKNIAQSENTSQINHRCKLKKVFYNNILSQEYHYNNENKLIRIDRFLDGKVKWFFALNYDEQGRISFSEDGFYFYYSDEYAEENELENPAISQLTRFTYQYDKMNNSQINTMKVYSGKATKETTVEENMKYKNRYLCSYNSKDQLVKVEKIHKKRRKKKLKNTGWYELEYENNNAIKIKDYHIRDKDTILYSVVEREHDSIPNLQFNHGDFMNYPGVIEQNNLIYFKRTFLKDNPRIYQEFKVINEYDINGLLIKSYRNTIHPKPEKNSGIFSYEYTCE